MNEQLYGATELTPTSKPLTFEGSSVASHDVHLPKREKSKKKHVAVDTAALKKKASNLRVSSGTLSTPLHSSLEIKRSDSSAQLTSSTLSSNCQAHSPPTNHSTSTSHSISQQIYSSSLPSSTSAPPAVKDKKMKKPKRRKSAHIHDAGPALVSESTNSGVSLPSKSRPEALNLPVSDASHTPGHCDGPDTGDLKHMLQELLHPHSVSLVTPIPTPNKVQPFVFPSQPSVSDSTICTHAATCVSCEIKSPHWLQNLKLHFVCMCVCGHVWSKIVLFLFYSISVTSRNPVHNLRQSGLTLPLPLPLLLP